MFFEFFTTNNFLFVCHYYDYLFTELSVNGFFLGSAFRIPAELNGHCFFPHVLLRGQTTVRLTFSSIYDGSCPLPGYTCLDSPDPDHSVFGVGIGTEDQKNEVLGNHIFDPI